jgi:hypothetical protein
MSDYNPRQIQLPKPNPVTARRHRRQFRQQVLLPVIAAALVVIGLGAAFWQMGIGNPQRWAEISTIFLVLPLLLVGLVLLVLFIVLSAAINEVLTWLPPYTRMAQQALERVEKQVAAGMEVSTRPVMAIREYVAMIERFVSIFTGRSEDA